MSKELIFVGKREGKVRLALFDTEDGTARRLPIKEVDENVFITGVKEGKLPVKGFKCNRGRISSIYGSLANLEDVTNSSGFTVFGLVDIISMTDIDFERSYPTGNISAGIKSSLRGLASIEWSTGMFRVLAPSTYFMLKYSKLVNYDGVESMQRFKSRLQGDSENGYKADYVFNECDSTESLDAIRTWLHTEWNDGFYVFFQWLFQRCEGFCYVKTDNFISVMLGSIQHLDAVRIALLGTRELNELEVTPCLRRIAVIYNRKVNKLRLNQAYGYDLYGFNDVDIYCTGVTSLNFGHTTRARFIKDDKDNDFNVSGWNGYAGSNGDYTDITFKSMYSCFNGNVEDAHIKVSVIDSIEYSFNHLDNVVVELSNYVRVIRESFNEFKSSVSGVRASYIRASFNKSQLAETLDISFVHTVIDSFNDTIGDLILPEYFYRLSGTVFSNMDIHSVLLAPFADRFVSVLEHTYSMFLCNKSLDVVLDMTIGTPSELQKDMKLEFASAYTLDVNSFILKLREDSYGPKFTQNVAELSNYPLKEVTKLHNSTFYSIADSVVNLAIFPNVTVLPNKAFYQCESTVVILNDAITKIEKGAFAACKNLRHIYIPSTVKEIELGFVTKETLSYTIYTQEGSSVDVYAKKYKIPVKYVADVQEFKKMIDEIPDELEGIMAVANLLGKEREDWVISNACETTDVMADIETKLVLEEKIHRSLQEFNINILDSYKGASPFSARMYVFMANISNEARCNLDVLDVPELNQLDYRYINGEYAFLGKLLVNGGKIIVWLVVKGDMIVNCFTETMSYPSSSWSLSELIYCIHKLSQVEPTGLSTIITQVHFGYKSMSLLNKKIEQSVYYKARNAIMNTYVPIGIYREANKGKVLVVQDLATLQYARFKLNPSLNYDDGKLRRRKDSIWNLALDGISVVQLGDTFEKGQRMYNILSTEGFESVGDKTVAALVRPKDIKSTLEYDYKLPLEEVADYKVLLGVMQNRNNPDVTLDDVRKALRKNKLSKPITSTMWDKMQDNMHSYSLSSRTVSCQCKDGEVTVYMDSSWNTTIFMINAYSDKAEYYAYFLPKNIQEVLEDIVDFYDTYKCIENGAAIREEHYAHVNSCLPLDEFILVREFNSGGCYSNNGYYNVGLLVSKVSGKVVVALTHNGYIIPVFWTNTFADALRILSICGMKPFSYNKEWDATKGSICSGVYQTEVNKADFRRFSYYLNKVRENLRAGYSKDYVCMQGKQELFDLALKHPRVSDYERS